MKILVFGIVKEIAGAQAIEITPTDGMTVHGLRQILQQQFPELAKLSAFMIAVNNEYAAEETVLSATDEIAIIPPVSGG